MRARLTVSALALAALLAGPAAVAGPPPPGSSVSNPATRVICLDLGGETRPAVCTAPASRLDGSEDICLCPVGQRVDAPVCAEGERPQAETRAFERARKAAAVDGSLVGDLYDGRPMCIAPRNR